MIVVDTNVIAYFLIEGEPTADAEKVYDADSEWVAPLLWRSEMRSLLALYVRRTIMSATETFGPMSRAEGLLAGREYDVESHRVLELAHSSGCTAYDCEFIYVAERLNVPLVTSDKKLLAAFPSIAVSMADFAEHT
mgnify:CR=1 FL=1